MKKTKEITANPKLIHFFLGTPGILTMHCKELINVGDNIRFPHLPKHEFKIVALQDIKLSNYYKGHRFYELKFSIV